MKKFWLRNLSPDRARTENRDLGSDALVTKFVRDRSETAFRALYRAHAPMVTGLCMRMLSGTQQRAEDACQETWMRAIRSINRFEGRSRFSTWLCSIAVNVVHEMIRSSAASQVVQFDPDGLDDTGEEMGSIELSEVGDALLRLPTGYRAAVILHDIEGFTHQEIAEILGIAPGTAKSQLSRARASLRALLSDEHEIQSRPKS